MLNRYNVALIPRTKGSELLNFTEKMSGMADSYKLSEKSLPHITVCQFIAQEKDIESIWEKVCKSSDKLAFPLTLKNFSCITIDNSSWVSLLPDNIDILMELHVNIANLIESRIGRCFEKYDPHLTLINTKLENYSEKVFSLPYVPIQDEFVLSLGLSDNIGQLNKIIYCNDGLENRIKMRG